MTPAPAEIVALTVAGGAALVDWWSVRADRPRVESGAKPLVLAALMAVVVVADVALGLKVALLVAVGFGLVGDVLLLPSIDRFIEGLAAFLVGHLGYIAAALAFGTGRQPWLTIGGVAVLAAIVVVGRPIVAAVAGSRLRNPVLAYVAVIAVATTTLIGTGRWSVAIGAALFAASDGLLGWTRFVDPRRDLRWLVHAAYHLGQGLIVVGLTGGL